MPNFKMTSKMATTYAKFYLFRHRDRYWSGCWVFICNNKTSRPGI